MATAPETAAKLVEGVEEVVKSSNTYKADVAAAIVDLLLGSDPQAIVRGIKGIPPELFEIITDGLVAAIRAQVLARLNTPTPPAPSAGVARKS